MLATDLKAELIQLLASLPDDLPLEELIEEVETFLDVALGEADVAAGRLIPHSMVMRHFGLE